MPAVTPNRVQELLTGMRSKGLGAAKELIWTELNYDRVNTALSYRSWPERARQALAEPPILLAQHGSPPNSFDILYAKLSPAQRGRDFPLSITAERLVVNQLLNDHPYALFLFSDTAEKHWHWVNVRYAKRSAAEERDERPRHVLRRIAVGPQERLRTAAERIAMLDLETMPLELWGLSPLPVQQRHDEAFDVQQVTDAFYRAYEAMFGELWKDLERQTRDRRWAHDFSLQFLNRLMFLYFVQRKGWLGDNRDFVETFWKAYGSAKHDKDSFVRDWLNVLFFEAFNNRFQAGRSDRQYLPAEIREALAMAPFLNGGLFERNRLDEKYSPTIRDSRFEAVFEFMQGYNFTISEDTPLDQEVAVDPEMIGKVYESLVNVSDSTDERAEAGIFYTPRVEIDLMCRLSLVDWLTNHLGAERRSLLYETVFAFDNEEKEAADQKVAAAGLWPRLEELLGSVTVVDPACGSGSFLVGMLYVLDDLLARAEQRLGRQQTPYQRKKTIIANSLYGVDVMDWAVHVAELRLWLQLVIDSDLEPGQLKMEPLLPNLSFKVRPGDSLVQEVGGINMALRRGSGAIAPALQRRIAELQREKVRFYTNQPDRKYRYEEQVRQAELNLFREVLEARALDIDNRLKEVQDRLRPQTNLFGEIQQPQMGFERLQWEAERDRLSEEREQVRRGREALRGVKDIPFVWDIAFVEVMEGARRGFDIVIGNPPYVRTQRIAEPREPIEESTPEDKRRYKAKLARAVYTAWPLTFGYNWTSGQPTWKLDAKSDLYIYFYFLGLSLLNDKGSFCFITSNSWLDVGYGGDLQEFLLTRGKARLVIDNQARRSFARAEVNTVIVLLGAAQDARAQRPGSLEHTARFVMLKVPFEEVLSPVIWEEVEDCATRCTRAEHRTFPVRQADLLASGMDLEKKTYAADKWGGKYLRAPDIYWILMDKGAHNLVPLGQVAFVNEGKPTGANEFFYPPIAVAQSFNIEGEFLVPAVMKTREASRFVLKNQHIKRCFLTVTRSRRQLAGTNVLKYLQFGEAQGLHKRATFRSKKEWYRHGVRRPADLLAPCGIGSIFFCALNEARAISSNSFAEIRVKGAEDTAMIWLTLNSVLGWLYLELVGRSSLGGGLLKVDPIEYRRAPILKLRTRLQVPILDRAVGGIKVELDRPDRRALDNIVFDALGLTQGERDAVYEAVINLVEARLKKADSL